MVDVVKQLCIHSHKIRTQNDDYFEVKQGREYTTSLPKDDEEDVTVYSNYWVKLPKKWFVISETDPYRNNASTEAS